MTKKLKTAQKKNKKIAKATSGKNARVEKLEVVVSELIIRIRDLEAEVAELRKTIGEPKLPAQSAPWPVPPNPPAAPWNPIWHNVWTTVDYAKDIYNKFGDSKNEYKKHPGDQT